MRDAILDWLGFTVGEEVFPDCPDDTIRLIQRWMPTATLGDQPGPPRNFYRYTRNVYAFVGFEAVLVALICWGGERQRRTVNVQLNGKGCALVEGFQHIAPWLDAYNARLTRVDTAVDFLDGEYTVDSFFEAFKSGGFNWNNAPKHRCEGPWGIESDDGRTLYIGKKENGKEFCAYEKGKQCMPGDSPWNRAEIRWFNKDRVLPVDMLTKPAEYVAKSYPCFQEIMQRDGVRIPTDQNEFDMTADRYTEYLKRCAGKIIHTLRHTYHTDADMLDQLAVVGIPKRLRKASLMLVRGGLADLQKPYLTAEQIQEAEFTFGQLYRAASG